MCRYRYYFYGTCRHQETILLDFCDKALLIHKRDVCRAVATASTEGKQCDGGQGDQRVEGIGKEVGEGAAEYGTIDRPPAAPTTTPTTHSSPSPRSSFETGSQSITAESAVIDSSLPADHRPHSSTSASSPSSSSHDMAGLPRFEHIFRQWMVGSDLTSPKSSKSSHIDPADHLCMTGKSNTTSLFIPGLDHSRHPHTVRQPGIRDHSDESWDLPSSNDILQHLAESPHSHSNRHIGTDGQRASSCASTAGLQDTTNEQTVDRDTYDCIEAEIDQLKKDVMKLRHETGEGRKVFKTEQESAGDKDHDIRNGRRYPATSQSGHQSAAARLQRLHEAKTTEAIAVPEEPPVAKKTLSPSEFPSLGERTPRSMTEASLVPGRESRRPSYADIASNGMMAAIGQSFTSTTAKRKDTKLSDSTFDGSLSLVSTSSQLPASSTATAQDSFEYHDDGDCSVIISPQDHENGSSAAEQATTPKGVPAVAVEKPVKRSPHFAQPTQSFSRRTGEKLRKDAGGLSTRSPVDTSPLNATAVKEPTSATNKRAHLREQQKRKSLPGDWIGGGDTPRSSLKVRPAKEADNAVAATPQKLSSPATIASPSSAESCNAANATTGYENSNPARAKAREIQGQSSPLKKKSSYMSPTTATTQRNIATRGQEKMERKLSRINEVVKPIHNPETDLQADGRLLSCTLSSDQSSVQFILDRQTSEKGQSETTGSGAFIQIDKLSQSPSKGMSPLRGSPKTSRSSQKPVSRNVSKIPKPTTPRTQHATEPKAAVTSTLTGIKAMAYLVKNTTTKRRTSHGHVLQPIVARLHSKGLLQQTSLNNNLIQSYLEGITVEADIKESLECSQKRRERAESSKSSGTDCTDTSEQPQITNTAVQDIFEVAFNGHEPRSDEAFAISTVPAVVNAPVHPVTAGVQSLPHSRVSSLRATANVFTPQYIPQENALGDDIRSALEWRSEEQWMAMSVMQKKAILAMRDVQNRGGMPPWGTLPPYHSPPGAPNRLPMRRSWADMTSPTAVDPTVKFVNENGSPKGVQAGQILKPSLTSGNKTVQWMLQDLDGKERPVTFGRAPPPPLTSMIEPSTPVMSPTSDDTSAPQTPHSFRRWHIGSALSRAPYAWAGGDGKEIRFIGHGPHAERDPNNVVNFNFQGRTVSYNVSVPNGFNNEEENFDLPADVPVAPKSQRRWAEGMGYPKVPCGTMEIVDAVEYCVPFGQTVDGYCHGCVPGR